MKVLHCCLSCFYIDGHAYQENQLVQAHVAAGHEVLVLAATETFDGKGGVTYREPGEYMGTDGARVIRLPYRRGPHALMRKLRLHPGVYAQIEAFAPDAILFHGVTGYEIVTVARYARDHPQVVLNADSHESWGNSAKGVVAREILHRLFYGACLRRALPQIDRVLSITVESRDFVKSLYRVPDSAIELLPLGGYPVTDADRDSLRAQFRGRHAIDPKQVVFAITGKMRARRKLLETLRAFTEHAPETARLFVAGLLVEESRVEAEALMAADDRITFLGWQDQQTLTEMLCGTDIYLNPGSQTATTQHSLCCHCAVALDDVAAHRFLLRDNGWLVGGQTSLGDVFREAGQADLAAMQARSYALACEILDYGVQAERVLRRAE